MCFRFSKKQQLNQLLEILTRTECQQETIEHVENEWVPSTVFHIEKSIHSISSQEWVESPGEVTEREHVVLLSARLSVRSLVSKANTWDNAQQFLLTVHFDVYNLNNKEKNNIATSSEETDCIEMNVS